jgi:hypothetical protein
VTLETVSFEGHGCVRLDDGAVTVMVTTSVGPRVLGFIAGEGNLMAVLPGSGLERPGGGRFTFVGGHRLWAAPEIPEVTYEPDDRACAVTEVDGGVRVQAPPNGAGFAKTIGVRRTEGGWSIDHELRNDSGRTVTTAAWAITQLRPGGTATLPLPPRGPGPQADRSLVLWPYTDLADPRIVMGRGAVHVRSAPAGPALKVGVAPGDGTLSYRIGAEVFEKRIDVDPSATYADRGAALQVYLCDDFCELETLGPLTTLEPGGSATHRERWTLREANAGGSDT